MIRRVAFVALMLLAALGLAACSSSSSSDTLGGLKIAATDVDLGEIPRGEKGTAVFKLENVGKSPVTILNTRASCGCTAAVLSEKVIAPGKTGEIKVTFDTRGRRGPQRNTVRVETDDPVRPQVTLTVTAQVIVDLDFERPVVRFQPIRRGETQTRSMSIVANKLEDLVFGEPESDLAGLTAQIKREKTLDGQERVLLDVTYAPTEIGTFSGRVRVPVNRTDKPELALTVSARVDGEIAVIPMRANIRRGQPENAPSVVRLTSADAPFKILSIKESRGLISVEQKVFESENGYELRILPKGDHDQDFATEITVTTDHPKMNTVVIPVVYGASNQKPQVGRPANIRLAPNQSTVPIQRAPVNPPAPVERGR